MWKFKIVLNKILLIYKIYIWESLGKPILRVVPNLGIQSLGCPILRLGRFQVWAQHIYSFWEILLKRKHLYDTKYFFVRTIELCGVQIRNSVYVMQITPALQKRANQSARTTDNINSRTKTRTTSLPSRPNTCKWLHQCLEITTCWKGFPSKTR